jgi:hypothetical protein
MTRSLITTTIVFGTGLLISVISAYFLKRRDHRDNYVRRRR